MTREYAIKARKRDSDTAAWWFVAPRGGMTRLRVHANRYGTEARAAITADDLSASNPDHEFKVVPL